MKYLSICSGIEAASVAFKPLGWQPLAFSEIEPFPRAVLQHHYPDVPLHGDFTSLKSESWIVDADMLCGGTPCQSFSIAGSRGSLSDDRGNLTLQFVNLANAIDHLRSDAGKPPAWILWENVGGVLNTPDNAFGSFLGGLCGRDADIAAPEGGWTRAGVVNGPTRCVAWRTLDAQHFGLAQRRQRVFVLALGGAGRWAAADALLPIAESSAWHPAPGRGEGEGVAGTLAAGAPSHRNGGSCPAAGHFITEVAGTIGAQLEKQSNSLDRNGAFIPVVMATGQGNAETVSDGSPSLTCNHEAPIVVYPIQQITSTTCRSNPQPGDPCPTLTTGESMLMVKAKDARYAVRRLTPVEAARLQGFPDTYSHILTNKWRKIPADEAAYLQRHGLPVELRGEQWYTNVAADGPIYKGYGNSWATNVVNYIGRRIEAYTNTQTNKA